MSRSEAAGPDKTPMRLVGPSGVSGAATQATHDNVMYSKIDVAKSPPQEEEEEDWWAAGGRSDVPRCGESTHSKVENGSREGACTGQRRSGVVDHNGSWVISFGSKHFHGKFHVQPAKQRQEAAAARRSPGHNPRLSKYIPLTPPNSKYGRHERILWTQHTATSEEKLP